MQKDPGQQRVDMRRKTPVQARQAQSHSSILFDKARANHCAVPTPDEEAIEEATRCAFSNPGSAEDPDLGNSHERFGQVESCRSMSALPALFGDRWLSRLRAL